MIQFTKPRSREFAYTLKYFKLVHDEADIAELYRISIRSALEPLSTRSLVYAKRCSRRSGNGKRSITSSQMMIMFVSVLTFLSRNQGEGSHTYLGPPALNLRTFRGSLAVIDTLGIVFEPLASIGLLRGCGRQLDESQSRRVCRACMRRHKRAGGCVRPA